MLDINLIQGRPALQVEYHISLAADLLHTLALVMDAPWIEGLDQWIYATHAALPPTLKDDMETVLVLTQKSDMLSLWLNQLPPEHPVHQDFSAFINWLNALAENDLENVIHDTLQHIAEACCEEEALEIAPAELKNTDELRTYFDKKFGQERTDRIWALAERPLELKTQLVSVLARFWEQFYHDEYRRNLPLMQRSIEYHRRQNYAGDLATIFTAITGRRLPQEKGDLDDVEQVVFFPSCHIGPYVVFARASESGRSITIHYNSRPTAAPERESPPPIQDLFPPLKALADETRLQILALLDGRELYAQEIVDQLDISQSAVSRHLQLMVTGGLLTVRKADSMKYFSINAETLAAAAGRLKSFRGKPS